MKPKFKIFSTPAGALGAVKNGVARAKEDGYNKPFDVATFVITDLKAAGFNIVNAAYVYDENGDVAYE
jgi:hypothetical protein